MQDALITFKRQVKGATLTLEQGVPARKAYLIPNPSVKVQMPRPAITICAIRC